MSWFLALAGIIALIVLHELGHFAVAKAVGMRVERFSLFFPPTILRIKRGETEYAIGALPFGGYVKIAGMNPEELKVKPAAALATVLTSAGASGANGGDADGEDDGQPDADLLRRAYYNQAPWKRVAVILAGPGVNILIAFGLFWAMLAAGNLNGVGTLEVLNPSIQTRVPTTSVAAILKGEPADGVLKPGDELLAVDGAPASSIASVEHAIGEHRCARAMREGCSAAKPVTLRVRRARRTLTLSVYPRYDAKAQRMLVGFDFGEAAKHFGVFAAATTALDEMWGVSRSMIDKLGRAFTNPKVRKQFSSIVGITVIAQESVSAGAGYALVFLGFISLVLAVMNLFPFLPLDGGHILWAVAEKVRGKRISLTAMYRYSSVGIVLLLFLVINGLSNDISRLTH
jgi:regulator of sigma E protease